MLVPLPAENRIGKEVAHQDHVPDLPVFQIQPLESHQVIADKFLDKLVVMGIGLLKFSQTLADTHTSHFEALRGNKGVFVKKRNLKAAASDIQDSRSFLDHLLESCFFGGNGLISQEMLFRVA